MTDKVTIALPSKGAIAEPTLQFLTECGLRVEKPNPRQYTGSIPALPDTDVLFQRVTDIVYKVADGTAQLGITGLDVMREFPDPNLVVVHPDLHYGYCKLLVAVPESWVDVESIGDLGEIALDFREEKGRNIRIATTYPNLARAFMHAKGIHHFTLAHGEGAIEAAPTIGYADFIVDLVQTGTTLRENHLKPLPDGVIVESQACVIGNRQALLNDRRVQETARAMCEQIDGALQGRTYSQITTNIQGENAQEVARRVSENPLTFGLQGPTIAPIYTQHGENDRPGAQWFTITIITHNKSLLKAVERLRELGASQSTIIPVRYVFLAQSPTYQALLKTLQLG